MPTLVFEGQNELLDRVSFSLGNEPANERFYNEMVAYLNEAEAELNRMREELSESKQLWVSRLHNQLHRQFEGNLEGMKCYLFILPFGHFLASLFNGLAKPQAY